MEPTGKLSDAIFPIKDSDYYKFWLREQEEINRHKWVLSEKIGRDVGWDYAHWNWHMAGFRIGWIKSLKASGVHTY